MPDRAAVTSSSASNAPGNTSGLSALATAGHEKVKVKQELADTRKELNQVQSSEELLNMMVPDLEKMRHEMKDMILKAKRAMTEAGIPTLQKADKDVPYWYDEDSWSSKSGCPWNSTEKRAMTPAEGFEHLADELANRDLEIRSLKAELRELKKSRT